MSDLPPVIVWRCQWSDGNWSFWRDGAAPSAAWIKAHEIQQLEQAVNLTSVEEYGRQCAEAATKEAAELLREARVVIQRDTCCYDEPSDNGKEVVARIDAYLERSK